MKMIKKFKYILLSFLVISSQISCFKDLDTVPIDPDLVTANIVFDSPTAYKQVLAKLYAGLAVTGQNGPAGNADIGGIDEGFGQYLRMYFYHQELTTDEAIIGWNDQTIANFHNQNWTASDGFTYALYSRLFYQISACNEYLRQTSDAKLEARGDASLKAEVASYRAEARFLRALSYWHALDLFRNVPFVTENDPIGNFQPRQATPQELFSYLENELKDIEKILVSPKINEYGRADQAAAWMLMTKLLMNAQVYVGQDRFADALIYAENVIDAGYDLEPNYQNLFTADNHSSKEIIFPIAYDGIQTRTYGGTTFIVNSSIGGSMNPSTYGARSGWAGLRTTPQLYDKFPSNGGGLLVDYNEGPSLPSVFIPGSFQSFDGLDANNRITSPTNNKIYEGYRHFAEPGGFIVLRFPSANVANALGDADGDGKLTTGGGNIAISEAGTYYIRVNLNDNTVTIQKQVWSIQGSAVPGGSLPLSFDPINNVFSTKQEMLSGTFQFVTNTGVTIGDNGLDGSLAVGETVQLNNSGGYEISLNATRPNYYYKIGLLSFDNRGMFYTTGQTKSIDDIATFTSGYAITKFRNINKDGTPGKDKDFADVDFPVFRLADAYLMAAEAILRTNGDKNKAISYYNTVKTRAFRGSVGNVSDLQLQDIIEERAREFYWECHRRTDLVRFGQFTNSPYIWEWKGGTKEGQVVDDRFNIFPIPTNDLAANPTLKQNNGY